MRGDPSAIEDAVAAQPLAATALAVLLRTTAGLPVWDGIAAEASTYGLLLGGAGPPRLAGPPGAGPTAPLGPPAGRRRAGRQRAARRARPARGPQRDRHRATRDALVDALAVAAADPAIADVVTCRARARASVRAATSTSSARSPTDPPRSRCAWPATRDGRCTPSPTGSPPRSTAPCIGAGLELPAFAGTVVADPGTTFRLPEVAMGLVPGAGGTVSLTRRIGRHRSAWLALTGHPLHADAALDWDLVDASSHAPTGPPDPPRSAFGSRTPTLAVRTTRSAGRG